MIKRRRREMRARVPHPHRHFTRGMKDRKQYKKDRADYRLKEKLAKKHAEKKQEDYGTAVDELENAIDYATDDAVDNRKLFRFKFPKPTNWSDVSDIPRVDNFGRISEALVRYLNAKSVVPSHLNAKRVVRSHVRLTYWASPIVVLVDGTSFCLAAPYQPTAGMKGYAESALMALLNRTNESGGFGSADDVSPDTETMVRTHPNQVYVPYYQQLRKALSAMRPHTHLFVPVGINFAKGGGHANFVIYSMHGDRTIRCRRAEMNDSRKSTSYDVVAVAIVALNQYLGLRDPYPRPLSCPAGELNYGGLCRYIAVLQVFYGPTLTGAHVKEAIEWYLSEQLKRLCDGGVDQFLLAERRRNAQVLRETAAFEARNAERWYTLSPTVSARSSSRGASRSRKRSRSPDVASPRADEPESGTRGRKRRRACSIM